MSQAVELEIVALSRRDGWFSGTVRFGDGRNMEFFVTPSGGEVRVYSGRWGGNNRVTPAAKQALLVALGFPAKVAPQRVWEPRASSESALTRMAVIAKDVALARGLTLREMKSETRARRIARPRQEAMAAIMDAGFTSFQAGGFFNRDPSTAIQARQAVLRRLEAAR